MSEILSKQRYHSAEVRKRLRHVAKIINEFENPTISKEKNEENSSDTQATKQNSLQGNSMSAEDYDEAKANGTYLKAPTARLPTSTRNDGLNSEITKVELAESAPSTGNAPTNPTFVSGANLLKNVEKYTIKAKNFWKKARGILNSTLLIMAVEQSLMRLTILTWVKS